jgi:hypothetical protein
MVPSKWLLWNGNVVRNFTEKLLVVEISENDCNDSKFHSQ